MPQLYLINVQLEGEEELTFSRLYAIDGNNSLKRMRLPGDRVAADTCVLSDSDYFLPQEYVDRFAHEVRGHRGPALRERKGDSDASDVDSSDERSVKGDPTDGLVADASSAAPSNPVNAPSAIPSNPDAPFATPSDAPSAIPSDTPFATPPDAPSATPSEPTEPMDESDEDKTAKLIAGKLMEACVKNWKANSSEEVKKMWAIFEETGIFVAACRHGMILWIIDMIRSGEL